MKRLFKIILSIISTVATCASFSGCSLTSCSVDFSKLDSNHPEGLLEQGDYQYNYIAGPDPVRRLKDGPYVAILGLTESGKEKKTLIIPEEIDGKPVIQIGMSVTLVCHYGLSGSYRRVYLPSTLLSISYDAFHANSRTYCVGKPSKTLWKSGIFVSKEVYEQCRSEAEAEAETEARINLYPADVEYYFEDNLYWLDSCTFREPQKIAEPPEPEKAGYEFLGWFEENSETPWDFENDKIDYSKQDEQGNYIRVKMIAKFQKIN